MKDKPTVVIGLLGSVLDAGVKASRWERWRPSVSLCQQEDLQVDRLDLLSGRRHLKLANQVEKDVRQVSPETEVVHHPLELSDPWDFQEVFGALFDFAREYPFEPDQEDYLVHITTGSHVAQICLFLLTESRHLPARLIQTSPPARGRPLPGGYTIIDLDLSRYDQIASRFAFQSTDDISYLKSGIETRNASFNALIARIEQVALRSTDPLLLTGPTGAGKSLLARRIYELKRARHLVAGDFVEVNCATLRGDAAMSALFGHRKGAFTGASADRDGLLRAADRGVLFLDEVAELGLDEQAMLLRAVEEKRFLPMGADREVSSDFQLFCGTNRDLAAEVAAGRFRDDLLARIDLWTFRMPGLAERREDIEPNLRYELERHAERVGERVTFNREALTRFLDFATSPAAAWSGNFRDLSAAVTRMATLAPGGRITPAVVDEEIARLRAAWSPPAGANQADLSSLLDPEALAELDLFDRLQLVQVLSVCRKTASLSEAGRRLFQASRRRKKSANDADRLRKYLARHGLSWGDVSG